MADDNNAKPVDIAVPHSQWCQCEDGVNYYYKCDPHEIEVGGVLLAVDVPVCLGNTTHPKSLNTAMDYLESLLGVHFRNDRYYSSHYEEVRPAIDSFRELLLPVQWAPAACANRCAPYRTYYVIEDEVAYYDAIVVHCAACNRVATKKKHDGFYLVSPWGGNRPNKGQLFCSLKCQRSSHEYKEFKRWERAKERASLSERGRERMDAMLCMEQIQAVKSFLKTGNREALQSRLEELSLLTTSPAS
jgi:hypothetical protein